jgi:hypothetical protein
VCLLVGWRRQQAGDALVKFEEEGYEFGVGAVGLSAAAGLVGGVNGGAGFVTAFDAGINPSFAKKQCPRINFVPIKTHLVLKKLSLNANGKFSLFWLG